MLVARATGKYKYVLTRVKWLTGQQQCFTIGHQNGSNMDGKVD